MDSFIYLKYLRGAWYISDIDKLPKSPEWWPYYNPCGEINLEIPHCTYLNSDEVRELAKYPNTLHSRHGGNFMRIRPETFAALSIDPVSIKYIGKKGEDIYNAKVLSEAKKRYEAEKIQAKETLAKQKFENDVIIMMKSLRLADVN
jgi:hypothetical protein